MTSHLSEEQIGMWLIGERTAASQAHVDNCLTCRTELLNLEQTLGQFRTSVHDWSEEQLQSSGFIDPLRQQRPAWLEPLNLRWAAAALLLCLCGMFALDSGRRTVDPKSESKRPDIERASADTTLLKQVDLDVSRTVPAAMDPLVQLVSWDTTGVEAKDE